MDLTRLEFPAHNAIFHITKGLIFNRTIAFQVKLLFADNNDRNIPVQNEPRLKERLFKRIKNNFNNRLRASSDPSNYQFTDEFKKRMIITDDKKDIFEIQKFYLSSGLKDDETISEFGGVFSIFPLTFVCKKCGDLQYISRKNIRRFDPSKCIRKRCDGEYEQLSIMLYCEICGNIRPFHYTKGDKPVRLVRKSKDSIATWKVQAEGEELLDIFRLTCEHKNPYDFVTPYKKKEIISNAKSKAVRPLTVTEGSIYIPVAETNIDIPTSSDINLKDLEYILIAISLDKFAFLKDIGIPENLKTIQGFYQAYHNDSIKELAFKTDPSFIGKNKDVQEELWRKRYYIDRIEEISEDLKKTYPSSEIETIRELNDFAALIGKLGIEEIKSMSYNQYLKSIPNIIIHQNREAEFEKIKKEYNLEDIIYTPSITLINSCYGLIHGINKFFEPGFKPHFEPIWKTQRDPNKGFYAFSYPYKTEGIIFKLNKQEICQWLYDNKIIAEIPKNSSEITDFFSSLKEKEDSYKIIRTLLHTFSHLLMRSSSLYTGLDLQSYGEKLFPTSAATFIFSTSSINIGGLQFIFEHEVFNWFEDIRFDVRECTLDPNCIKDKGACFSCMYIPEFVCCNFNQYLDRDVFIGKVRYKKGFW